jgi:hypothetical protein
MSIDTADPRDSGSLSSDPEPQLSIEQRESLHEQFKAHAKDVTADKVFGPAAKRGAVYRWGFAASTRRTLVQDPEATLHQCDELVEVLSRLACGERVGKSRMKSIDLPGCADFLVEQLGDIRPMSVIDSAITVLWAAAMPALTKDLDQARWWRTLSSLQCLHDSVIQHGHADSPAHLMLGGELGLTLAWRLYPLHSCAQLQASSIDAVTQWCAQEDESVPGAITNFTDSRLVLASLIRSRHLIAKTSRRKLRKKDSHAGAALATWVAAMTTHTGGTAFSAATKKDVSDDLSPHGLLAQATEFASDELKPAVAAALGATQTGGRLVWEVDLPESLHHDPHAKIAVMFPDWDVRRGRTHVDYSRDDVRIELFAGRTEVIAGDWQTLIELDREEQRSCGVWEEVCEYSDDDVHYLEIEQRWTGDIILQRQIMLIRDDRCVLLADAVMPESGSKTESRAIKYSSRLPLLSSIAVENEQETREIYLGDGRRRGLVIPLSANEWQIARTTATFKETDDHHLLLTAEGHGSLYAPLWFDFQQRRFKRKRTWRQLTVADNLKIVGSDEAVGYRLQLGSEQWFVYRSLADQRCRSVLGTHLIADFFCSRFDPGDGSHEELLTVDDSDSDDD